MAGGSAAENGPTQLYFSWDNALNWTIIGDNASGIVGSTLSNFNTTTGIKVDEDGNIYVSDLYNSRVVFWFNGASSTRFGVPMGVSLDFFSDSWQST